MSDKIYTPRNYQKEALDAIHENYPEHNRQLVAWATGLGKGLIPVWLAERYPRYIKEHGMAFIAHRRKILFQAYERFKEHFGKDYWIGLEMGEYETTGKEDVVFFSIDSVGRIYQERISKYKDRHFGILLTDESHHLKRESKWDRVLNFFGVGSDSSRHYNINVKGRNLSPLLVNLTATPEDRMAPFVDKVVHRMSILDGIKQGWLTDIKSYHAKGVDSISGLCKAYQKYLEGERTLIFASDVEESKCLTEALNSKRIVNTAHVDAKTPKEKREDIYKAFDSGTIRAISNRLVLTEGADFPKITAILDNAPSLESRVCTQKWGRGVRVHPEANVDNCETAEERKQAIRNSPKPFLTLLCTFDPTETGITLTQVLSDYDTEIDEDEDYSVEEVIEVIEEFEEERPELDVDNMDFEDVEIHLKEADIFRRTIYNDRLKAITKLNWVTLNDKEMAIWLPQNPFTTDWKYKNCPTVFQLGAVSDYAKAQQGENVSSVDATKDERIYKRIVSGGWNGQFPAKVKSSGWKSTRKRDMQEAISDFDKWLRRNHKQIYDTVIRGSSERASSDLRKHLLNKGVPVSEDLTEETALLLKYDSKIRNKISKID